LRERCVENLAAFSEQVSAAVDHWVILEVFVEVLLIGIQLVYVDKPRLEMRSQLEQDVGWRVEHQTLAHKLDVVLVVKCILPYTRLENISLS
jgi:hypothetical protein